jgi:hypothetical protein
MIHTDKQNPATISRPVSPCFDTSCLSCNHSRELADESAMITTQMGSTTDQEMVAVAWTIIYDTTPY